MFNYLAAEFIYFATDLHRLPLIFFIKKQNPICSLYLNLICVNLPAPPARRHCGGLNLILFLFNRGG